MRSGQQGLVGFVEGLNNKVRGIQRRSYGLRDEDYLRLKILTCMLPQLRNGRKSPTRVPEDGFFSFVRSSTPTELCVRRDRPYEARRELKSPKGSSHLAVVNGVIRAIDEEPLVRAEVRARTDSRRGR